MVLNYILSDGITVVCKIFDIKRIDMDNVRSGGTKRTSHINEIG